MKERNIYMINAFPLVLLEKEDFNAINAFLVPWIPPKNIFEGNESSSSMTLTSLDKHATPARVLGCMCDNRRKERNRSWGRSANPSH
jgi:hypothetical protein